MQKLKLGGQRRATEVDGVIVFAAHYRQELATAHRVGSRLRTPESRSACDRCCNL